MRPTDIDWREALEGPEWTDADYDYLIHVCQEKKDQLKVISHITVTSTR